MFSKILHCFCVGYHWNIFVLKLLKLTSYASEGLELSTKTKFKHEYRLDYRPSCDCFSFAYWNKCLEHNLWNVVEPGDVQPLQRTQRKLQHLLHLNCNLRSCQSSSEDNGRKGMTITLLHGCSNKAEHSAVGVGKVIPTHSIVTYQCKWNIG